MSSTAAASKSATPWGPALILGGVIGAATFVVFMPELMNSIIQTSKKYWSATCQEAPKDANSPAGPKVSQYGILSVLLIAVVMAAVTAGGVIMIAKAGHRKA